MNPRVRASLLAMYVDVAAVKQRRNVGGNVYEFPCTNLGEPTMDLLVCLKPQACICLLRGSPLLRRLVCGSYHLRGPSYLLPIVCYQLSNR